MPMPMPVSTRFTSRAVLAAAAALGLWSATATHAQPAQVSAGAADAAWRFQLTPYVWMTGISGQVRPVRNAPTAQIDQSFADVVRHLDAAFFIHGTARKGRYVLHGDFSHARTSDQAALPYGLRAQAKVQQSALTLAGGYHWPLSGASAVDVMAGVRWWEIQAELRVPGMLRAQSRTAFADPIVATRWRYGLGPRWSTLVYADVGGFGVGSRLTWQAVGTLNYQWQPNLHLSLGYRHLRVNYQDHSKKLDFSQSGPMLGLTYRF